VLYLASSSPQRTRLLADASVPHVVVPSTANEDAITASTAQILALDRAAAKARAADLGGMSKTAPCVVLGADTVVALGRELLGKPRDRAHAIEILSRLQGTTHMVVTGHCLLSLDAAGMPQREARGLAIARVTMRSMDAAEIAAYVESGEADGRAGAYAIQESGDRYVVDLEGSFDTVVGLHVDTVARLYRECTDSPLPGYVPIKGPGSGSYPTVS
jgi:septum formation protein